MHPLKKCRAINIIYNIKRKRRENACNWRIRVLAIPNTELIEIKRKKCEKLLIKQNQRMTNRSGSWKYFCRLEKKKKPNETLVREHFCWLFMMHCGLWVFPSPIWLGMSSQTCSLSDVLNLPASSALEVFASSWWKPSHFLFLVKRVSVQLWVIFLAEA